MIKARMNRVTAFLIAILLSIGLTSCQTESKQASSEQVEFGAVLLLSGNNAQWGQHARRGIDMVVDQVNKQGGVDGDSLKVIYEDTEGEQKSAVSSFRKLVNTNNVPIVLGDMLSSTTLAMAPLANDTERVLIGISTSAPAISEAGPYVYRVWPSDTYEGSVFARYVFSEGYKSIGIIYLNNDYGNGLRRSFKSEFLDLGGEVLIEEGYRSDSRNLRSIAARIDRANPEGVYIVGYYEDTARFINALREAGVKEKLFGTSSAVNEELFRIGGDAAESFTAAVVNDFDMSDLTKKQELFLKRYKSRYGEQPDWAATHGADAARVATECLKLGYRTGTGIKTCIDSTKSFDGISQSVTFDKRGDVVNKPIAVKTAKEDSFVTAKEIKPRSNE